MKTVTIKTKSIFLFALLFPLIVMSFKKSEDVTIDNGIPISQVNSESLPKVESTINTFTKKEVRFKNLSFKIPESLILDVNMSNDNKQVYVDNINYIGLTIDVGLLSKEDENSTIKSKINNLKEFGLSVNEEQRKIFSDLRLRNATYGQLGNVECVTVSQTSTEVSGKNILMVVVCDFVISYPYYYAITYSYPENRTSSLLKIYGVMGSFKFENNITVSNNIKYTNYKVNQKRAHFYSQPSIGFRRNAYLVFGETIYGHQRENGFVYVDYLNSSGIKTSGWLLISDLK
jgi:hypothetical protein